MIAIDNPSGIFPFKIPDKNISFSSLSESILRFQTPFNSSISLTSLMYFYKSTPVSTLSSIVILTNGLESWSEIEDESIDFIFSQAVLEHIPKNDFRQTMIECHRILKQNGVISHTIDLKDHLGGASVLTPSFLERVFISRVVQVIEDEI